ncbi:reverse transcriptase domain-containing protein [Bacillus sp. T33-2]|uniref:reverse transcriptase domain-containing protein n=1 Tax=Bacillus sp. T33-2 TaxID=2054168 RepID=UPI000C7754AF|nr:reverse transcriptase domain-containing protein [Bacillus sp. T33-2]PLR94593.1 hypothetical protein CVD19_16605 [Bacillus sp. T33-2]
MRTNLNKELLEFYYLKSYNTLSTGLDKISATKFTRIKDEEFKIILKKIENGKYQFTRLKHIDLPDNRRVYIPTIRDRLVIDYLKDALNNKYKIKYKNRDEIIQTLQAKLTIQKDYYIIRLDIKNFFSSIPHNKLLYKLKKGALIPQSEYILIKELLKRSPSGIPQGMSISNSLSEIYLEQFDMQMKRIDQRINYYCRYVDDILLIFNGDFGKKEKENIKKKIEELLNFYGLEHNSDKFIETPSQKNKPIQFEYLGYDFSLLKNKLYTSISSKKVNRLKRKINSCFDLYIKDKKTKNIDNINLLIERLNVLTKSQFLIKKEKYIRISTLKEYYKLQFITSGFISSYKYADKSQIEGVCQEIDRLIIKRTNSLKTVITSRDSKRILYSISMYRNYKENKVIPISRFTTNEYRKRIQFINPSINNRFLNSLNFNQLERHYFQLLNIDKM